MHDVDVPGAGLPPRHLDPQTEGRHQGLGQADGDIAHHPGQLQGGFVTQDLSGPTDDQPNGIGLAVGQPLGGIDRDPDGSQEWRGLLPSDADFGHDLARRLRSEGPKLQVEDHLAQVGGVQDLVRGGPGLEGEADDGRHFGRVEGTGSLGSDTSQLVDIRDGLMILHPPSVPQTRRRRLR